MLKATSSGSAGAAHASLGLHSAGMGRARTSTRHWHGSAPRLRWELGQAGEGGREGGRLSGCWSGAGVREPGRSRPKGSPGCQPALVRQPEQHRAFSEAWGAPQKQQDPSHAPWPCPNAARLLPEQGRAAASAARPGTLPRAALRGSGHRSLLQAGLYSTRAPRRPPGAQPRAQGSSCARQAAAGALPGPRGHAAARPESGGNCRWNKAPACCGPRDPSQTEPD